MAKNMTKSVMERVPGFLLLIVMLVVLSAMLSGCSLFSESKPLGYDAGLLDRAPAGSPGFRYGWKEGCRSGLAAYGSLHYKLAYKFSYDVAALDDDEYQQAWELGFRHCRWYISSWS